MTGVAHTPPKAIYIRNCDGEDPDASILPVQSPEAFHRTPLPNHQPPPTLDLFSPLTPNIYSPRNGVDSFHSSNIHFMNDEPLQLIQERSIRRKEERLQRIHDLECTIAKLTAQLANATINRQRDYKNALSNIVHVPLDNLLQELSMDNLKPSEQSNWMQLEQRVSAIQAQMIHAQHVTLVDECSDLLDPIQHQLDELEQLESSKRNHNHNHNTVASSLASVAGTLARHVTEERAARVAALQVIAAQSTKQVPENDRRLRDSLQRVQDLRDQLAQERALRVQHDGIVKQTIANAVSQLQRAFLHVVGDDDDDGNLQIESGDSE
jgi:hypothetical protein